MICIQWESASEKSVVPVSRLKNNHESEVIHLILVQPTLFEESEQQLGCRRGRLIHTFIYYDFKTFYCIT